MSCMTQQRYGRNGSITQCNSNELIIQNKMTLPIMQNSQMKMNSINRREFLWTTVLAATGAELVGFAATNDSQNRMSAYGGFRMGLESFSLRHFDMEGCLERMKTLDLRYIEMFSGH